MAWCCSQTLMPFILGYTPLLISTTWFLFFIAYRRSRRSSMLPANWPIVGMLLGLLANLNCFHDWITDLLSESSCTFLFRGPWFFHMDYLFTADPANINHIFNVNFSNYPKGNDFSEMFDILGDGIFNVDGESWKRQRQKAHSLMADRRFRSFVAKCSKDKVERGLLPLLNLIADQDEVVDLQDVFMRLTFDLTCNNTFGVDPGSLGAGFPIIPFAKAVDDAAESVFFRHVVPGAWWKLLRFLRVGKEKKLAKAWEVMDDFVTDVISKRRVKNSQEIDQDDAVDLLTSYIQESTRENPTSLDDKFLRDTTLSFMIAGRDTTGVAIGWLFWLLTQNPHAEMRILDELKTCSPRGDKRMAVFEHKDLEKLVYLHAAICESLRLYPPGPLERKAVLQPEILPSGAVARPGTMMIFSIYAMGRMEGVWGKDCMEFKPERWISEDGMKLRHEPSYKFLTFNSGPRSCLGRDIAFTQIKAVVAAVVYNFHVEVVKGHVVEPKLSIILLMKNGLKVRVKKRGSR